MSCKTNRSTALREAKVALAAEGLAAFAVSEDAGRAWMREQYDTKIQTSKAPAAVQHVYNGITSLKTHMLNAADDGLRPIITGVLFSNNQSAEMQQNNRNQRAANRETQRKGRFETSCSLVQCIETLARDALTRTDFADKLRIALAVLALCFGLTLRINEADPCEHKRLDKHRNTREDFVILDNGCVRQQNVSKSNKFKRDNVVKLPIISCELIDELLTFVFSWGDIDKFYGHWRVCDYLSSPVPLGCPLRLNEETCTLFAVITRHYQLPLKPLEQKVSPNSLRAASARLVSELFDCTGINRNRTWPPYRRVGPNSGISRSRAHTSTTHALR